MIALGVVFQALPSPTAQLLPQLSLTGEPPRLRSLRCHRLVVGVMAINNGFKLVVSEYREHLFSYLII